MTEAKIIFKWHVIVFSKGKSRKTIPLRNNVFDKKEDADQAVRDVQVFSNLRAFPIRLGQIAKV